MRSHLTRHFYKYVPPRPLEEIDAEIKALERRDPAAIGRGCEVTWPAVQLRRIARFAYGDSLSNDVREAGAVAVYGSNGPVGTHVEPNTLGPALVIGRKGSFGKVQYTTNPVFAIDTTFYVDRRLSNANLRWLYYALQTMNLDDLSEDVGVPGLSREKAYAQVTPLPPLTAQCAIANYLDRETAQIDALIAAKQRMVELLEERLRSFIAILYTGLCASYGSVAISRLCAVAVDCVNKTAPLSDEPTDFQMLRTTNVKGGIVDYEGCSFVSAETFRRWNRRVTPMRDDVLLAREAPVGEVGIITEDKPAILGQRLMLFRADARLAQPEYLVTMLQAPQVRSIMDRFGLGAAHPHLKVGQCLSIPIPNASLTAQQGALNRLSAVTEGDATMKLALTTQGVLLQERRQALITAAVTGQLDIPEAA